MSKLLFKDFFEKWRTGTDFKDIGKQLSSLKRRIRELDEKLKSV